MHRFVFEAGTVVVRSQESAESAGLVGLVPHLAWDARINAARSPAYRYRAVLKALRRTKLPFRDDVLTREPISNDWTMPSLRPYQHAALLGWHSARRAGLVVLPTGSGKTRLACATMAATRAPALCLVPTRVLLHQWRDEIAHHYRGAIGCLGDGERRIEHVTVATFEGAYRHMPRIGNRFGLLVVDEAHHFGGGMRDEALEMCAAPLRLGLTATAPDGPALTRIMDLIGPIVCELAIGDLAGEWLAAFDSIVLPLHLSPDQKKHYDDAVARFRAVYDAFRVVSRNAPWNDFVAMASKSEQGRAALAAFRYSRRITSYPEAKRVAVSELLQRHRASRVLIFTPNNETAYAIAREHLVMPITCDIDRAERELALSAFRTGQLRALVSARVLNEGLDVPDADVAIIVGGTSGQREHVQRVGRLLRPSPGKRALVYELVTADTHEVRKAAERRRALGPPSSPSF